MEKNGITAGRKRHFGLLKIFSAFFTLIFLNLPAFSKTLSRQEIKNLVVKADSEAFFTAQENGYTLLISGIESSLVQNDLAVLPAGVKLVSSKKEDFFDGDGDRGTRIQFWFTFTDIGIAKLPPLIAKIQNRTYYLPFEEVQIYENPNLISPILSIEFEDESKLSKDKKSGNLVYTSAAREKINYRVNIQYFLQIINYSWNLPRDSIFFETKRYEIAEKNAPRASLSKEFTPQKFPVAEFSWQPLKEGDYEIPQVFIESVSYNGSRKQLASPSVLFHITKEKTQKKNPENPISRLESDFDSAYKSAFAKSPQDMDSISSKRYTPTLEDCKKLAELRSKERKSLFSGAAAEKRREFEISLGIVSGENETKNPFSKFFGGKYAIFKGGKVSSVPEEKTAEKSGLTIPAGQRVKLSEKAGGWIFIENKDFSGWVKEDSVFIIK